MSDTLNQKVIVALDMNDKAKAMSLARNLQGSGCWLKVGLELYCREGLGIVQELKELGFQVFLDLKLHDIPNTVASTIRVLVGSGVEMINVHCSGGYEMLARAAEATFAQGMKYGYTPKIVGVTVLTSLTNDDLQNELQIKLELEEYVLSLAYLAQRAGLNGVVCSAQEAKLLRRELGEQFLLVTPGIRPHWSTADDQARITTPQEALRLGSTYLVVGRPVTQSLNPRETLELLWD